MPLMIKSVVISLGNNDDSSARSFRDTARCSISSRDEMRERTHFVSGGKKRSQAGMKR